MVCFFAPGTWAIQYLAPASTKMLYLTNEKQAGSCCLDVSLDEFSAGGGLKTRQTRIKDTQEATSQT